MGRLLLIIVLCASTALAQQANGSLRGQILDEFGGAIVGSTVVVIDAKGTQKTVTTNDQGMYVVNGLVPGKFTVRVATSGFAPYENTEVNVAAGRGQPLDITLKVTIEEQRVTIESDNRALSTDAENNAGAIVLKGADLESLPEDPDDLAAALQALAGPSAGPNGGQIFIDGFTGGRLPPLASIREIRINSNPFSSEYDRPGFGRIEILTKPGTDRFRGQVSFGFNDNAFNSRNPFAPDRPPYQSRQYGGNFGGPISKKKASFFVDFEKRDVNDDALVVATILDANLATTEFRESIPTPSRRTTFSPRFDYQINANNTLVGRYSYAHTSRVTGVGGYSLASRAYHSENTEQSVQLTETAVINKKIVNETRFRFEHQISSQDANNTIPTINVQEAFISGGSQVGQASNTENQVELTNTTSMTLGAHALKFGARVRYVRIKDISPQNFGGSWTFGGSFIPGQQQLRSIERYQLTLQLQRLGVLPADIRLAGGGATQFSVSAGNPEAEVSQFDLGGFVQDDWKMRKDLTLNIGLRYENQNNISSHLDFAPRLAFAWQLHPKTVIRGGFGMFYDRIGESLTLQANRFNGTNQLQYTITDPVLLDLFPTRPSVAALTASPVSIYRLANDIEAPYTMQSVIGIERQLPKNVTMSVSYINARTDHLLRARAVGLRIFDYESSGRFRQNQLIVSVNNRLSRSASLTAFYVLAKANSDTDGSGTFPANSLDLRGEYGRSSQDVRHRFTLLGSYRGKWGISLNPMFSISSGSPFNITLGRDLNSDILFTERPSLAPVGANCNDPSGTIRCTRFGNFNLAPGPGDQMIPRNFGTGPISINTRLGISKTFGFGKETSSAASRRQAERTAQGAGGAGGAGRFPVGMGGGPGGGGDRGGGPGGGGARGGGGFQGGGGGDTGRRYSLTISINTQNVLNYASQGRPSGNLSSTNFGLSTSSGGNFGGGGGGGACGGACNRRIDASVRFSF